VFFVVQGHATLITGGTSINPQGTEEIRGDSVKGGSRVGLKEGDVAQDGLILADAMDLSVVVAAR
jgi:hypothetical protein